MSTWMCPARQAEPFPQSGDDRRPLDGDGLAGQRRRPAVNGDISDDGLVYFDGLVTGNPTEFPEIDRGFGHGGMSRASRNFLGIFRPPEVVVQRRPITVPAAVPATFRGLRDSLSPSVRLSPGWRLSGCTAWLWLLAFVLALPIQFCRFSGS